MSHSTPVRVTVHRPDLLGKPRAARTAAPEVAAKPPSVGRQMVTGLSAAARWLAAGRPKTSPAGLQARRDKCGACPNWNPAGWMGRGRCTLCGCSGVKLEWATEQCPKPTPEWLPETPQPEPKA